MKKFSVCICLCLLILTGTQAKAHSNLIWRLDPTSVQSDSANTQPAEGMYGSIYQRPYSVEENIIDKDMLWRNTGALIGTGLGTMAFLYMMPESFTNWSDEDKKGSFKKWWDNVSHAPVWDKDDLFLNYVTHPYAGAIYYMGARSAGVNAAYSFLYSFMMSTFFWEYGIEAFAERPSIQDLIVTPVAGAVLGEWFYRSKRDILENDGELWGSTFLGRTSLFLMDPITEIADIVWGASKPMNNTMTFTSYPMVTRTGHIGYGLSMRFTF